MKIEIERDGNYLSVLTLSGIFFSLLLSHAYLFPYEDERCPLNLTKEIPESCLCKSKIKAQIRKSLDVGNRK